jgi:hypothetical protein
MAQQPRRQSYSYLLPWEPEILPMKMLSHSIQPHWIVCMYVSDKWEQLLFYHWTTNNLTSYLKANCNNAIIVLIFKWTKHLQLKIVACASIYQWSPVLSFTLLF